ncbi:MAG: DEAD/DEAH box helicase [Syntrophobacteraceae bacterium]
MHLKTLNILVAEWIKIPTQGLSPLLERKIHERLVFTNPDYEARHSRGEWLGSIAPQISCIQQTNRHYLLPRGFLDQLLELCKKFQQPYRVTDKRRLLEPLDVEFHGQLKDYQQEAAEAILTRDFTTLVGGHKSGKTIIALYAIAQRRQPALVLIPKLELLDSWLTKIENFLQIPPQDIGVITETMNRPGKGITIAHTGEIPRNWRALREQIGFLILDECQRCPSKVFSSLIPKFDARYMLGLANSTQRRDRLSRFIYYYIGDVTYTINEKDAKEGRGIIHAHVVARTTDFDYPYHSRADYPPMLDALMTDPERNRLIALDIEAEVQKDGEPLIVISGGEEQERMLSEELGKLGIETLVYKREENTEPSSEEMDEDSPRDSTWKVPEGPVVVLVNQQTFAESFRALKAKVLVLAVPLFFRSRLAYAIRNIYQNGNGSVERLKIYDYVDHRVGLLENYFRMRSYNYGVHPDVLLDRN